MNAIGAWINSAVNWQFLDEPVYRWAIFIGVMLALMAAWGGILREMR